MMFLATILPAEGTAPAVSPRVESRRSRYARWAKGIYELPGGGSRSIPMEGLRGLAVALVFFVHFHALLGDYARNNTALWNPSKFLGLVGNTGVDIFFVLSGYLIYGTLVRS